MTEEIQTAGNRSPSVRAASLGALAVAVVLVAVVLLGGNGGHRYKLLFETGGQLVTGNEVTVGGAAVGEVKRIALTDDNQAEVEIETDQPLHEGTTARIRVGSLGSVADRYVALEPGPNDAPRLDDGGTITAESTTAPVDVDQLFATFDRRTRAGLSNLIRGYGTVYTGNSREANRTYEYLAPALQSSQRLLAEVSRDQHSFTEFLGSGSRILGAVATRRDDLATLSVNANRALGALARESSALDRALGALPGSLRQANTTFANVRAALDDVDPLVDITGEVTPDIAALARKLKPVVRRGIPVARDLGLALRRKGRHNDLGEALADLPGVRERAVDAVPTAIEGLDDLEPKVAQLRPYAPDLFGTLRTYGQATAYYDANGHYARVLPAGMDLFSRSSTTQELEPIPPSEQFADLDTAPFNRCPGGATQPIAGSNPFLDAGALVGVCDPLAVPPGP